MKKSLTTLLVMIMMAVTAFPVYAEMTTEQKRAAVEKRLADAVARRTKRIAEAKRRAATPQSRQAAEAIDRKKAVEQRLNNLTANSEDVLSRGELLMLSVKIQECPEAIALLKTIAESGQPVLKADKERMLILVAIKQARNAADAFK